MIPAGVVVSGLGLAIFVVFMLGVVIGVLLAWLITR